MENALQIRFTKRRDGATVISYTRPDGTNTGQRGKDDFFAYHDLQHYAVETTLGLTRGFLGLVAGGWDLTDFGSPWPKGRFRPEDLEELMLAEGIAGYLGGESTGSIFLTAAELNAYLQTQAENTGTPALTRYITDEELSVIRETVAELTGRWRALPDGETLEIWF